MDMANNLLLKLWLHILTSLLGEKSQVVTVVREKLAIPAELRGATLVLSEVMIRTLLPVQLHGKPDQVVKTTKQVLVPVDTKTRKQAKLKMSDVIQLGVYAAILRNTRNEQVAEIGYVRVMHPETHRVVYLPVKLMTDLEIVKLHHRREMLRSKKIKSVRVDDSECYFCQHKTGCPKAKVKNWGSKRSIRRR